MNLACTHTRPMAARRGTRGFTLAELMVSVGITALLIGISLTYTIFASVSMSGITAQSELNDQVGRALAVIQSRARFATSISNDASGSTITMGFDDNYNVDSDGDTLPYNDKNHFESFQFVGTSTNIASSTNSLVYLSTNGYRKVLIPTGVIKLPGQNIFTVTNNGTALIRFAVVDILALDRYQSVDIQGTAVILNRRSSTNFIAIIP